MNKLTLTFLFFLQTFISFAQNGANDSMFVSTAARNVIRSFTSSLNSYAGLYNGRAYDDYKQIAEEHPYLFLDWSEGTIGYFGKTYENVPLLFDLSTDEIVTEHSSGSKIALLKYKVKFFELKGHRYEYIKGAGLTEGFYDVLYSGSVKVVAKRQKKRREKISGTTLEVVFDDQLRYYLITENSLYSISGKRQLIKALCAARPDFKKRLVSEARASEKESGFVELASLYDQLISGK